MLAESLRRTWTVLFTGALIFFAGTSQCFAAWDLPAHNFGESRIGGTKIVSDNNGHAITLISSDNGVANAYYYTMGAWTASPTYTVTADYADIDIAMEDSGTAIIVWNDAGVGFSSYFDGVTWNSIPTSPFGDLIDIAVAMNGPNSAIAVWTDGTDTFSATFLNGVWDPIFNLGPGGPEVFVAYSTNGTAVAGWTSPTAATASIYSGGSWQSATALEPNGFLTGVGIDANGKAVALYLNVNGALFSSFYNGSTWSLPTTLDTHLSFTPVLSMGANGVAVAIWSDSIGNGYTSTFNGSTWDTPIIFTSEISDDRQPAVSVNSQGDVLIIYGTTDESVKSIQRTFGSDFRPPITLQGDVFGTDFPRDFSASLSPNGVGYAAWSGQIIDIGDRFTYAAVTVPPAGPIDLIGLPVKNKFVAQTDPVNVLCWTPSTSEDIVSYQLRRNGIIIATIPAAGPFCYYDHCRCKGEVNVYTLTSVGPDGSESLPLTVVIN